MEIFNAMRTKICYNMFIICNSAYFQFFGGLLWRPSEINPKA